VDIYLPKYKPLILPRQRVTTGISGEYRLQLRDINGRLLRDTGWFDNGITNNGMNTITSGTFPFSFFSLGSDGSVFNPASSTLGSFLGFSSTAQGGDVIVYAGAPNYETSKTRTKRFAAGVATGTVREVGVGSATNGSALFSRAVVTPEIVKASDQILDVSYRLTYWPPLDDVLGTTVIEVDGVNETFNTITRALNVDSTGSFIMSNQIGFTNNGVAMTAYDGNLNADLEAAAPQGNFAGISSNSNVGNRPYVADSHYRDISVPCPLNGWILGAGIRSIQCGTTAGYIQTQFNCDGNNTLPLDATIPKTGDHELEIRWRVAWAVRP
jgi:hypothetical protein